MNLHDAIHAVPGSLEAEGRSPHTVAAYRRDLAVFVAFAGDQWTWPTSRPACCSASWPTDERPGWPQWRAAREGQRQPLPGHLEGAVRLGGGPLADVTATRRASSSASGIGGCRRRC